MGGGQTITPHFAATRSNVPSNLPTHLEGKNFPWLSYKCVATTTSWMRPNSGNGGGPAWSIPDIKRDNG